MLITLSEALARREPSEFSARHAIEDSCALMRAVMDLSYDLTLIYPFVLSG